MLNLIILPVVLLTGAVIYGIVKDRQPVFKVPRPFPAEWKELLQTNVHFYQNLNAEEKTQFENDIRTFLKHVRVTGIKTKVEDLDRLLAACSAVIPLFGFPKWEYDHLDEVLIYPKAFDKDFSTEDPKETILGMVGSGNGMDGMMILSKQSLRQGFRNPTDKRNVGIHEFVHIIDKQDGKVDGIPGVLNDNKYMEPWLKLMYQEIDKIKKGKSDIDKYGATSEEEFLAVTSEYFFERPKLFQKKHPELYNLLRKVYHQNMARRMKKPFRRKKQIGRNDDCPCGSGEKFKNCCLNN